MSEPVVEIAEGKLKGKTLADLDGGEILAFLAIPFAKPPVGELRFKNPQQIEPWTGVRDSTNDSPPCIQRSHDGQIIGSEDCLYLNVFTKSVTTGTPKPVFVFIHGGAFTSGCNQMNIFGPDYLLTEDIVLVTINYRIGMLGFLWLEDPTLDVPGNVALKDQILALKWVQRNIDKFGGDPNNVTLAGESAGSRLVNYHMLSPLSKGLFHKAVAQSGVYATFWPEKDPRILDVLKLAGVDAKDEAEALSYLKALPVEQLYELQEKHGKAAGEGLFWRPVIEKPHPSAFISEDPEVLITSGRYNQVPLLMGYCNREGLLALFNIAMAAKGDVGAALVKKDLTLEQRLGVYLSLSSDSQIVKDLVVEVMKIYLSSGDQEDGHVKLISDMYYIAAIVAAAELYAANSSKPVYLYQFSVDAGLNVLKKMAQLKNPGACHADDLGYMFKTSTIPSPEKGTFEEITVRRFVKLLVNFARGANPTPPGNDFGVNWKPVEKGSIEYLDIGESLTPLRNPEPERMDLWRKVWKAHQERKRLGTS